MEEVKNENQEKVKKPFKKRHKKNNKRQGVNNLYNPPYPKDVLDLSIDKLDLQESTFAALKKGNVKTLRDIAINRMVEMYRIQNIGKKQCFEIKKAISIFGIDYRPVSDIEKPLSQVVSNESNKNEIKNNQTLKKRNDNKRNKSNNLINENVQLRRITDGVQRTVLPYKPPEPINYLKFSRGDKFGLKTLDRKELIPAEYDDIFFFQDGLACVEKDGKYGYINEKNEIVIEPKYDIAFSFSCGYASVGKQKCDVHDGEKPQYACGYIDKQGEIYISLEYDLAAPFIDNQAVIYVDGKWGILDIEKNIRWI